MSIYTLDFEIPLKEIEDKIDAMKSEVERLSEEIKTLKSDKKRLLNHVIKILKISMMFHLFY